MSREIWDYWETCADENECDADPEDDAYELDEITLSDGSVVHPGEYVTRKNGKTVMIIIQFTDSYHVYCLNMKSGQKRSYYARDLIKYDGDDGVDNTKTGENEMTGTRQLYSFKRENGEVGYGTHIGTNSKNKLLIEVKGSSEILVFDRKALEEVLPYTFTVKLGSVKKSFLGDPDKVSVGDFLMSVTTTGTVTVGLVLEVDTKDRTAKSRFKGRKLVTEEF